MSDMQIITEKLIDGDAGALLESVQQALEAGISADDILQKGLIAGMDIVGSKMESGEMFIPEVLMAGMAMGQVVEMLKPMLAAGGASSAGKIVIGTVKGDLHDIGKNLVVMMMESAGFEVVDLGVDVEPEIFVDAIRDKKPNILALSALLTTTMPWMRKTIEVVSASGLRDSVKIIVGGAPVNQDFATQIGADAYAADAGSASKVAKALAAAC
jgi:5-methyltetrahydrofolate--homocysteine methyltransferase